MSCVALDGPALATYSCYMQSMLFYCRFSRKCDATERLMLFSGEPYLHFPELEFTARKDPDNHYHDDATHKEKKRNSTFSVSSPSIK